MLLVTPGSGTCAMELLRRQGTQGGMLTILLECEVGTEVGGTCIHTVVLMTYNWKCGRKWEGRDQAVCSSLLTER